MDDNKQGKESKPLDDMTGRMETPKEEAEENDAVELVEPPEDDGGTMMLNIPPKPKKAPAAAKPQETVSDKTMTIPSAKASAKPQKNLDKTMMVQRTFPYLMITSADQKGRRIDLGSGTFRIGRASENDLVLQNSMVSTHHAEIVASGKQYTIKDLNSTNGILVNGKMVKSHKLRNGDEIVVGETALLFEGSMIAGAPSMKNKGGAGKKVLVAVLLLFVVCFVAALFFMGAEEEGQQKAETQPGAAVSGQGTGKTQPAAAAGAISENPLQVAREAMESGEWSKAVAMLERASAGRPDDDSIQSMIDKAKMELFIQERMALGRANQQEELWEKAAYEYRRVLNVRPEHQEAQLLLDQVSVHVARSEGLKEAIDLVDARKWQEALDRLESLAKKADEDEESGEVAQYIEMARKEQQNQRRYEEGLALLKKEKPEEAKRALDGVAKDSVYSSDASKALTRARAGIQAMEFMKQAETSYAQGKGADALNLLDKALEQQKDSVPVASLKKRVNQVVVAFEEAGKKERSNDLVEAYRLYGTVLDMESASSNAYRQQAESKREALSVPLRKKADELVAKGDRHAEEEKLAEAASQYREALETFPSHEAARAKLDQLASILNRTARKLFQEAYVLEQRGDAAAAMEKWRQICDLVPPGNEHHDKSKAKLDGLQ